jgi:cyanophycinase
MPGHYFRIILSFFFTIVVIGCEGNSTGNIKGNLIIIGGGSPRPAAAMQKFIELAGGRDAQIAIIPMASEYYLESGQDYEKEFRESGVKKAKAFYILDSLSANADSTVDSLKLYTGFYFGGGDQNRLTNIFRNSKSLTVFRQRYAEGAVMGGTSAGAAIMSKIMITGEGNWNVLERDSVEAIEGFGFLTTAIIDQHFVQRSRFNRLLSLVIQYQQMGIGIDEKTAIWVKPNGEAEVIGDSVVLVLNPRQASYPDSVPSNLLIAKNLQLNIYHSGETFRINTP